MIFWLVSVLLLCGASADKALFKRISTFNICEQLDATCNTDTETNAETIWHYIRGDKTMLVYSDSQAENVGFVDISDPSAPKADGFVPLGGEPTTVRVVGDYAVVGVNTSPNFVNVTGHLAVVSLDDREIVAEVELPGQPDAVDTSKDSTMFPFYIAVAIENERDEDLGDGAPPQLPPGLVSIITIDSDTMLNDPSTWMTDDYEVTGQDAACRFPEDPEPEYVAISDDNTKVVISLQENNCNIVMNLSNGQILGSFSAGSVSLMGIDTIEESIILQVETPDEPILREPDGLTWIGSTNFFASANEGDLDGGSRGWSIINADNGDVVYDSGVEMEWETARAGHYPEERSGNKGNEPENVLYANFPDGEFVFVLSERSSVVFVYSIDSSVSPLAPTLLQILPVGAAPEGITAIPGENLVVIASEEDARGDKIRSSITIFELAPSESGIPEYPTVTSEDRADGSPIPFAALSGLASGEGSTMYSVEDSFFKSNRILEINTTSVPPVVVGETRMMDTDGVLADCLDGADGVEIDSIVNSDKTINIDPEGISVTDGGFWVVSEGRGTVGDDTRPVEYPNLLLMVNDEGVVKKCVLLDDSFQPQLRFGFEGVAEDGDKVVVAVQRAWGDDEEPRIAVYDTTSESWSYAFYPLDDPTSQNGGWVGLSDISSIGNGKFLVIERDNQGGPDAAIKKIYKIDLGDYSWENGEVLEKELYMDLMDILGASNGQIIEKVEGLAVTSEGDVWINTDNDGVDGSSGESLMTKVGTVELDDGDTSAAFSMGVMISFIVPIMATFL